MNERKLDHGSRINAADEGTLERSVGAHRRRHPQQGITDRQTPVAIG
jgi:hypothetical protein